MKRKLTLFVIFGVLLGGCTVLKSGEFVATSHFVHPGSKIKKLGPVRDEFTDWGFFLPPSFDYGAAITLFEKALNQKPGADMLVNYRLDTEYKSWPILIYTMNVIIEGEAADVVVGEEY